MTFREELKALFEKHNVALDVNTLTISGDLEIVFYAGETETVKLVAAKIEEDMKLAIDCIQRETDD